MLDGLNEDQVKRVRELVIQEATLFNARAKRDTKTIANWLRDVTGKAVTEEHVQKLMQWGETEVPKAAETVKEEVEDHLKSAKDAMKKILG